MDKLLHEFQAPRVVQAILSEANKDWFAAALREALQNVRSGLVVEQNQAGGDLIVTYLTGDMNDSVAISGKENVAIKGDHNTYWGRVENITIQSSVARKHNQAINIPQIIYYMRDRAGLLPHKGNAVYSFPHRTFQEYLAARHLTVADFPNGLISAWRSEPESWREVFLLAGTKVARGTPFVVWSLIDELCPERCGADKAAQASNMISEG